MKYFERVFHFAALILWISSQIAISKTQFLKISTLAIIIVNYPFLLANHFLELVLIVRIKFSYSIVLLKSLNHFIANYSICVFLLFAFVVKYFYFLIH